MCSSDLGTIIAYDYGAADAQAPATEPDESIKVAAAAATDSTK